MDEKNKLGIRGVLIMVFIALAVGYLMRTPPECQECMVCATPLPKTSVEDYARVSRALGVCETTHDFEYEGCIDDRDRCRMDLEYFKRYEERWWDCQLECPAC